jgi:hypothetical protein
MTNTADSIYAHYTLTPMASTTVFGQTDYRFECLDCDRSAVLVNPGHMLDIRANDHFRGECSETRIAFGAVL